MDRLRVFEVFATVVGQGSFTRAADKLETSPANVTRHCLGRDWPDDRIWYGR